MDLLIEIILEIIIGGSIEGATYEGFPKSVRIAFLIFVTLILIVFIDLLVWLFITSPKIIIKILLLGLAIFFTVFLVSMWYKIIKSKK